MNHNGSPVFLCTLDAERCFDSIWHDGLFYKLKDILSHPYWLFMLRWYRSLRAVTRWQGKLSAEFRVTKGTRQGSILSPAFFNAFIDDLLLKLRNSDSGIRVDSSVFVNSVAYADDVTLLAATVPGLQSLIDTCTEYADAWLFRYGIKCLIAGSHKFLTLPKWTLKDQPIINEDSVEILGVTLCSNLKSTAHVAKRSSACNRAFYSLSSAGILSHGLRPSVKAYLWRSVCSSTLLYGNEAIAVSTADMKTMESLQGCLVKRSLGIGKRSHHSALLTALGIPSVKETLRDRAFGLHESILQTHSLSRELHLFIMASYLATGVRIPGTLTDRLLSMETGLFCKRRDLKPSQMGLWRL